MKLPDALSSLREHAGDIGQGTRSLMVAVCLAAATAACNNIPQRPARDINVNQRGDVRETYDYYLQSEGRCVRDTVQNGKLIQRRGINCQAIRRNSPYYY